MTLELFTEFRRKQWRQIRAGGWPVLKGKARLLLKRLRPLPVLIVTAPIVVIPVILIRLIRPWLLVRIGRLESEAIGHFSLPPEIYLSEADCGLHSTERNVVSIWYLHKVVCNKVLEEKWRHYFRIWSRHIWKPIDNLNRFIPGGKMNQVPYRYTQNNQNIDVYNALERTEPHLSFSEEEDAAGSKAFQDMGIRESDLIVCFMVRDGAYRKEDPSGRTPSERHRNSSVYLLAPAMEELTELGYKAVRMGKKVMETLETANPYIIDYACNGMRTDMLDLFVISRCKFMVSTGTGVDLLAPTFRRPLVHVNIPQFGFVDQIGKSGIFSPKHFWSISEKRMLTFPEIFRLRAHLFTLHKHYQMNDIESVNNTPDEISDVISEMEQRISGSWVSEPEDEELQNRFRAIWPPREAGRPLQPRIGTKFLRKHANLLG